MSPPFDEHDVLYRFALNISEARTFSYSVDECVFTETAIYVRCQQHWWVPSIEYQRQRLRDFLIARLLAEREELLKKLKEPTT